MTELFVIPFIAIVLYTLLRALAEIIINHLNRIDHETFRIYSRENIRRKRK